MMGRRGKMREKRKTAAEETAAKGQKSAYSGFANRQGDATHRYALWVTAGVKPALSVEDAMPMAEGCKMYGQSATHRYALWVTAAGVKPAVEVKVPQ